MRAGSAESAVAQLSVMFTVDLVPLAVRTCLTQTRLEEKGKQALWGPSEMDHS